MQLVQAVHIPCRHVDQCIDQGLCEAISNLAPGALGFTAWPA